MRIAKVLALVLAVGLLFVAVPVLAQEGEREIEVEIEGGEGEPGDEIEVGEATVPAEDVDTDFDGTIDTSNVAEANPGNTLIIETGGETYEVDGIEDVPGDEIVIDGKITAGETVALRVRLGDTGTLSGGAVLTLRAAAAAADGDTPGGGVATGAGGTAGNDGSSLVLLGVAAALAVALTGGYALRRRNQN